MKKEAVLEASDVMGLNKALKYCGLSKSAWYYTKKPRDIPIDPDIVEHIKDIATKRPTYGTRRMAAQITRETDIPVNRKKIQRICRKIGWIEPQKTKKDIIRTARRKLFKPAAPNQLWETDITYIPCGDDGWCYCFNVLDVFTREWLTYAFEPGAKSSTAIQSIVNAVSLFPDGIPNLRLRTDNGVQYSSNDFRKSMKTLGIQQEFIWNNTPQQNGHIESFHGSIKIEYIWPHDFTRFQDAQRVLKKAIIDYNHHRIHSSLGYLTPHEYACKWRDEHK